MLITQFLNCITSIACNVLWLFSVLEILTFSLTKTTGELMFFQILLKNKLSVPFCQAPKLHEERRVIWISETTDLSLAEIYYLSAWIRILFADMHPVNTMVLQSDHLVRRKERGPLWTDSIASDTQLWLLKIKLINLKG